MYELIPSLINMKADQLFIVQSHIQLKNYAYMVENYNIENY